MNLKKITGFPGYFASDCGKILSNKGWRGLETDKLHEIDGSNRKGYLHVGIKDESGRRKSRQIHRLVAMMWCHGFSEELTVNHKDSNKTNNAASNLEWMTVGDNIRHSVAAGKRIFKYSGDGFNRPVWRTPKDGTEKIISPSVSQGSRDIGVDPKRGRPHIQGVLAGKYKTAYGYAWGYVSA